MCYCQNDEIEAERLYITHDVKGENEVATTYYYTSKCYEYKIEKDDFELDPNDEWKKGNGFITIDTTNGTAKVFMLNSKFGRFKSVSLENRQFVQTQSD